MQAIQLKLTCDACVASKVRCSGSQPCTRCGLKGFDCFYRPRKKRSRVKKPQPASTQNAGETMVASGQNQITQTNSIVDAANLPVSTGFGKRSTRTDNHLIKAQARRSWAVFFMLYKNYHSSCSRFWFDQQLGKIHRYLTKSNNQENLKQLNAWMESLDIDYSSLNDSNSPCMVAIRNNQALLKTIAEYKAPHFHVDGNLHVCREAAVFHQNETDLCKSTEKEFFKGTSTNSLFLSYHSGFEDGDVNVVVSPSFTDTFGINGEAITKDVKEFGILPYGVDVFSKIMSEDDMLALIQILVIKTNSFKCSLSMGTSIVRQIPSCHVFELNTIKSYKPIPFMIKMVHSQLIDSTKGIVLDFTAILEPMQDYPSSDDQITTETLMSGLILNNGSSIDSDGASGASTSSLVSITSPNTISTISSSGAFAASSVASKSSPPTTSSPSNSLLAGTPDTSEFDAIIGFDMDDKDFADPDLSDEFFLDDLLSWARNDEKI